MDRSTAPNIMPPDVIPENPGSPDEDTEHARKMDRDLSLMFKGAGLSDQDAQTEAENLGGNHPALRAQTTLKQTRERLRQNILNKGQTSIEQAQHVKSFQQARGYTAAETAEAIGCSRSHIQNLLALLRLPPAVQNHVINRRLSFGHAKAIGTMEDPEAMADMIIRRRLSVRKTELLARRLRHTDQYGNLVRGTAIPNMLMAERLIRDALHARMTVHDRAGRGFVKIHYQNPAHFNELITRLTRPTDPWMTTGPVADYPMQE